MPFEFDDDLQRVDLDAVWGFLSEQAYWQRWRLRSDVERQIAGAWRVVGCYDERSGSMVGFCRAISDGVSLAYLADVYVMPDYQRRGLGKRLVHVMIEDGPGVGFRWLLHTADAHGLYRRFGFAAPDEMLLERPNSARGPAADEQRRTGPRTSHTTRPLGVTRAT
jgi:ribosomal protein S18 acetylase RimI-like enzyme